MDSSINPGDLVIPLGGGPRMRVRVKSNHVAYCEWSENGEPQRAPFELAALVKWAPLELAHPQGLPPGPAETLDVLLQAARQPGGAP